MSTLSILGYAMVMCLAPVAPFVTVRWYRRIASVVKALRVLSREQRASESLYDTAEAIAGDAHNWRGLVDVSDAPVLTLDGEANVVPASGIRVRGITVQLVAPQPAPQNQGGPPLWPMIIRELGESELDRLLTADMLQRHEFGVAKYGVPLVASNGRDHLADAYQEFLDAVVYLRADLEKLTDRVAEHQVSREDYDAHGCVYQLYVDALDSAKEIRKLILVRDGK